MRASLKISILVVSLFALVMLFAMNGIAFANFGPHGGFGTFNDTNGNGLIDTGEYVNPDTDVCAGCHRAHTAVSGITAEFSEDRDLDGSLDRKNALLIGTTSSSLQEFCYTCHSDAGAGAATNIQAGVYDAGKVSQTPGYGTSESESGQILNGGGFDDMGGLGMSITSAHLVNGASWPEWGSDDTGTPSPNGGTYIAMDCGSCHDPHGSSNYRLLKDTVNGVPVGGYAGGFASAVDPTPQPFVVSNEAGYPSGGFRLHRNYGDLDNDGLTEPGDYRPDYTEARYAKSSDASKGMSGWCGACHTRYNTTSADGQGAYDATDGWGNVTRHRHPVNVPLSNFYGDRDLIIDTETASNRGLNTPWSDLIDIPLEHDIAEHSTTTTVGFQANTLSDNIGCLTCHRAHGTAATMSGYASSPSNTHPTQVDLVTGELLEGGGVPPAGTSALLRANNRGVCERCNNK
ncbi:MAG: cytochrome c3 family protein [Rubrobacteridae bacterium]|nr:cytochrome c3 family protein [Rubrobacteridae bacterium]